MLNGDSRSYMAGGVDTWKLGLRSIPGVDDGTTLPDTDRPFMPNGTGGFRTPETQKKNQIKFYYLFNNLYSFFDQLPIPLIFPIGIAFPIISRAFLSFFCRSNPSLPDTATDSVLAHN